MKPDASPIAARAVYRCCREKLQQAGIADAAFEAETLLQHVTGRSRFELDGISAEQAKTLETLVSRRAKREPLQYLLGTWSFMDLELAVGPGVLIPRPETEQVCLAALECLADTPQPAVLELCAGTGAMALTIQNRLPQATVMAVELDAAAFRWLEQNIQTFAQSHTNAPTPVCADALTYHHTLPPAGLDLIACNPPYVAEADYAGLEPELYFEPRQALVPPGDDLYFYRNIARDYLKALKPGGWLVFELGAGQGPAVGALLAQNGYMAVSIHPDYAGHNRIALAQRPPPEM